MIMPSKGLREQPQIWHFMMQRGMSQLLSAKAKAVPPEAFSMVGPQPLGQCTCCWYSTSAFAFSSLSMSGIPSMAFSATSSSKSMNCNGTPRAGMNVV